MHIPSGRSLTALASLALLIACAPASTPEPAPPAASTPAGQAPATGAPLIVGTAADYPPFAYYDEEGALAGLDIDLMRAIGTEIGREIAFKDFAFDGLIPALELGQIDAAIAAISATPERAARVAFGPVYYIGQEAVLAAEGAEIAAIQAPADIAPYRVGVERGTVYETWIQANLVETGVMAEDRLLAYADIQEPLADLGAGALDLVVLDARPAEAAVEAGGVRIVASGISEQRFAIALPLDDPALLGEVDAAMEALKADGTMDRLAMEHLQEPSLPLARAPEAAPEAAPSPPSCLDGMAFVADLSNPDPSSLRALPAGEPFQQVWQVRNTGTCTWDAGYRLVFGDGNTPEAEMGAEPLAIPGPVAPEATVDLSLELVAPLAPGEYRALWEIRNAADSAFGERLWLGVQVEPPPTPTPAPTETPVPGIVFSADPTTVRPGEQVRFAWDAPGARAVFFFETGRTWSDFPVGSSGSRVVWPGQTTSYSLRVEQGSGAVETRTIPIVVVPTAGAPVIAQFSVLPEHSLSLGACATLQWQVEAATQVRVLAAGLPLWDGAPLTGSIPHCPTAAGSLTYAVEALGPGGSTSLQHTIEVLAPQPGQPSPSATPPPEAPVIQGFSIVPTFIGAGECVSISWEVAGDTGDIEITRDNRVVLDNAAPAGALTHCISRPGQYLFTLTATGATGISSARQVQVQVQ